MEINSAAGLITILTRIIRNTEDINANIHIADAVMNRILSFDHLPTDKIHVFSVLLNNIMCLYHVVSHRQLIEVRRYNSIYLRLLYLTYYFFFLFKYNILSM